MKRLLLILLFVADIAGAPRHKNLHNTQLCLNTTPDFGKKHFIIGYTEKEVPVELVSEKKSNSVVRKKQNTILPGATLIDKNRHTQSFFTSVHNLSDILLTVITDAKKSVYIAAFALTDDRIAELVIEKHKQGMDVFIVTDAGNMKQAYSKIQKLVDNGVPVWCYKPSLNPHYKNRGLSEPFMHHKCICVDKECVVTGSANLTKAGQKDNMENINILRDPQAVNEHCQEFERLKKYCVQCKPEIKG